MMSKLFHCVLVLLVFHIFIVTSQGLKYTKNLYIVVVPFVGEGRLRNGDTTNSTLLGPSQIIVISGVLYWCETGNHVIRRQFDGKVEVFAGTGYPGHKDGPLQEAMFNEPVGLTYNGQYIYVTGT